MHAEYSGFNIQDFLSPPSATSEQGDRHLETSKDNWQVWTILTPVVSMEPGQLAPAKHPPAHAQTISCNPDKQQERCGGGNAP